ncbi:AmpG family muropeptide MFS transporter [Emcibacter nanhaiensis]|uniref:AmpG family muropeptide MFS transporter n=1 Tax=Emcibacter nanhaiensis TaxID=1505037 RepID=A0A501PIF2_9PROT|nr:MFS transporter [Emcibacter nanhaiensis]TPD59781.1 AmpG family muropeptide MFS transporter [Emcibacter nanhaiensis]
MNTSSPDKQSWWDAIEIYRRPRLIGIFSMALGTGFPLTMILATLTLWLGQVGVSAAVIGTFAAVKVPYAIKFLWSPLIDNFELPILGKLFGRRRSWLFVTQAMLVTALVVLGATNPVEDITLTYIAAICVGVCGASQDIVVDAYRIEILKDEELPASAAMYQYGYRVGNLIAGLGALYFAEQYSWHVAYYAMSSLVLFGTAAAIFLGEPELKGEELVHEEEKNISKWLDITEKSPSVWKIFAENLYLSVVVPFKEFLSRHGWYLILLFVLLLKVGDGMASSMTSKIIADLAFTNGEIAFANKTVGFFATIAGVFAGGILMKVAGTYRGLFIATLIMMVSNLSFAVLAEVGHNVPLLAFTIGFENFSTGVGGTLLIAYMSGLCNLAYTATQYALLSSFSNVGSSFLSMPSGYLYEGLGPSSFFIFTTVAALPGIVLLLWMRKLGSVSEDLRVKS